MSTIISEFNKLIIIAALFICNVPSLLEAVGIRVPARNMRDLTPYLLLFHAIDVLLFAGPYTQMKIVPTSLSLAIIYLAAIFRLISLTGSYRVTRVSASLYSDDGEQMLELSCIQRALCTVLSCVCALLFSFYLPVCADPVAVDVARTNEKRNKYKHTAYLYQLRSYSAVAKLAFTP
jgi:hypothetical protein